MKKQFTLILAMLMLANLAACGGDSPAPAGTTAADTADTTAAPEELTDGLPEVDMDGFTFKFYHNDSANMTWTNLKLDVAEQTGDALDDAIWKRNRYVEERFNCVLEETIFSTNQSIGANEISQEVMAGDSNFDLWFPRDYNIPPSIPYLRPMNDLPYVNLDAQWWFPSASSAFNFGGKQYGATSYFSLSPISRAAGIVFNEDLYEEIGAEKSPYDYVREGKWTLDTFYDLSKLAFKDLNGDGQMDDGDRYGFGSSFKEMWVRFINGAGVDFIKKEGDAYPEFTLKTDEAAIDKLLYIFNKFNDPEVYHVTSANQGNMDTASVSTIKDGTALFALGHPNNMGGTYRAVTMNVGYLPCPKYDEKQDRYYCTTWAGEMMVILKTLPDDRLENISIILEALSFDSAKEDGVMNVYKEVMMKGKYAINEDCMEMFDIVLNSLYFDFGVISYEGKVVNPLIKDIFASGEGNVASTLASHEPSIQALLEELQESIEANEG